MRLSAVDSVKRLILPSAETGSLFLERMVTVAVLDRSVPVLQTFTST